MGQDDQGVPNEDTHLIGTGKEGMASMGDISISSSMLPAIPSYCNRRPQHHSVGVSPVSLVSTASPVVTAGTDQNRANGRVSVLRGGPGGRVTSGVNGGEDVGYHSSPSDSVLLEIRSMDLEALGEGRRLRAGNYYKGHAGTILDVRGLAAAVPGWRLSHSLHQTVRVGSVRGITGLLGHPGCMAFQTLGEVAGVRVVDQEETPEGMVVTISRRPAPVFRPIRSRVGKLPKDVHVVVVGARCSGTDVRKWTVTAITDGAVKKLRMTTSTPNRMISRVEAIAGALRDYPGRRVAIPSRLVPVRLLSLDVRIRQVGLADAVEVLRGWNWKTRRQWLAGIRTENSG